MDTPNETSHHDLLIKYFAGEASPEEARLIAEWLSDPANKMEYDAMLKLWNTTPGVAIPAPPRLATVWIDLQARLQNKKTARPVRSVLRYAAAAAVIAVIVFGVIFYQRNTTDGLPEQYITIAAAETTRESKLPDSSVVFINKNSSIRYLQDFNTTTRSLELNGEAYFDVVPDPRKPFVITIGKLSITVVGTAFNVRQMQDAIEVQVRSGTVKMKSPKNEILVSRSETGIYNLARHELTLKKELDVNTFSYATKSFVFNDLPLEKVCSYLENAFSVTIAIDRTRFADCRITAQFDNKPLEYILDVITATVNASYTTKAGTVSIEGSGCK